MFYLYKDEVPLSVKNMLSSSRLNRSSIMTQNFLNDLEVVNFLKHSHYSSLDYVENGLTQTSARELSQFYNYLQTKDGAVFMATFAESFNRHNLTSLITHIELNPRIMLDYLKMTRHIFPKIPFSPPKILLEPIRSASQFSMVSTRNVFVPALPELGHYDFVQYTPETIKIVKCFAAEGYRLHPSDVWVPTDKCGTVLLRMYLYCAFFHGGLKLKRFKLSRGDCGYTGKKDDSFYYQLFFSIAQKDLHGVQNNVRRYFNEDKRDDVGIWIHINRILNDFQYAKDWDFVENYLSKHPLLACPSKSNTSFVLESKDDQFIVDYNVVFNILKAFTTESFESLYENQSIEAAFPTSPFTARLVLRTFDQVHYRIIDLSNDTISLSEYVKQLLNDKSVDGLVPDPDYLEFRNGINFNFDSFDTFEAITSLYLNSLTNPEQKIYPLQQIHACTSPIDTLIGYISVLNDVNRFDESLWLKAVTMYNLISGLNSDQIKEIKCKSITDFCTFDKYKPFSLLNLLDTSWPGTKFDTTLVDEFMQLDINSCWPRISTTNIVEYYRQNPQEKQIKLLALLKVAPDSPYQIQAALQNKNLYINEDNHIDRQLRSTKNQHKFNYIDFLNVNFNNYPVTLARTLIAKKDVRSFIRYYKPRHAY